MPKLGVESLPPALGGLAPQVLLCTGLGRSEARPRSAAKPHRPEVGRVLVDPPARAARPARDLACIDKTVGTSRGAQLQPRRDPLKQEINHAVGEAVR